MKKISKLKKIKENKFLLIYLSVENEKKMYKYFFLKFSSSWN